MSGSPFSSAPEAPSAWPRHAEAAAPPHPPAPAQVKHCPVCGRTYPAGERYYCSYHVAVLVDGAPPLPNGGTPAPVASNRRRLRPRWAVGALALAAALILGYSAYRHRSWLAGLLPTAEPAAVGDYPLEVTTASVVGGALKGRQVRLTQPDYPAEARAGRVTGSVTVEVTVDGTGRVVAARAVGGPEALRAAAEEAARMSQFKARAAAGRTGTIRYDFMLCRDSGDCV